MAPPGRAEALGEQVALDTRGGVGHPAGIFDLARYGERVAIRYEDGRALTYVALAAAADAAVAAFGPGRSLVLIEAANEPAPLLAYIGAMRAGHVVLLVSAETPPDRIAALVDTYRPNAGYRRDGDGWRQWTSDASAPALHPDLSLLLSTSGSTGSAKLVRLSRAAVDANAASIATYLDIAADDRAVTTLPFHYSYGLSVVHSHLSRGATILLTDRSVVDPAFRRVMKEGAATSLAGVPYTYELLDRIGFRDAPPPSLRTMTQAGGRLPPDTARTFAEWAASRGIRFFVMYGQTEATARMAYLPPAQVADHPDHVGIAIPGGAFALLDAQGMAIEAPETPGELVYRGPNVMMGYALDADDLARGHELDELRTGDIAQRNDAGLYRIVGRMSRFIKPFGVRVGLDEIEAMLRRRGASAAATGDDALLAVLLVERAGLDPDDERDRLAVALNLPLSAIDVAIAPALPLLPSGKTDYPAILAAARGRTAQGDDGIARLFAETFPRATAGPGDSFTSLGGDSLTYVALSMGLERAIGHLPPRWEHLTIAQLEALAPDAAPARRRWWQVRWIESEVLIRALAILAIVVTHASDRWHLGGGADVLLLLFGYNLSRYQFGRLTAGRGWGFVRDFGLRIIAPYYAFLLLWTVAKRDTDWPSLLLVSNYTGRFGSLMEPYWFLEMLFQTMAFIAIAFVLAPVRRWTMRHPWGAGVAMLTGGIAVALGSNALWPRPELAYRTPELLFWLVGLGWCMHRATGMMRRGMMIAAILIVLSIGYFHPWGAELGYPDGQSARLWFAGSCLLILLVPRVPLFDVLAATVATVAAASFYIYLTHVLPIHVLLYMLHVRAELLVVPLSVVPGIAAWWLLQARRARRAGAAD